MKIAGHLDEASLEAITTAGEASADKEVGRVYHNTDTNEVMIADGTNLRTHGVSVGDVRTSFFEQGVFQAMSSTKWVLADGSEKNSSAYAEYVKKSNKKFPNTEVLATSGDPVTNTTFYIEADLINQPQVTLNFDGLTTVDDVITAWNTANPTNTITLQNGPGTYTPDAGQSLVLNAYIPDMRGIYVRGRTYTRIDSEGGRADGFDAPEGTYDYDTFKSHSHDVPIANFAGATTVPPVANGAPYDAGTLSYGPTQQAGFGETAPRSITANFYIRIER